MRSKFDFTKETRQLPEIPYPPFNPFLTAEEEESIDTDALLSSVEERLQPQPTLTLGDVLSELEGAMMDD
jgi:hypothetical protein